MVLDATDLEGSIPTPYIPKLTQGDYELFIAINKVDCIPNTISKEKLKGWFASRLRSLVPELTFVDSQTNQDGKHLALVSSKETIGLKKLVAELKQLKGSDKKKYIHTIGVTNSGKSSLLNSLRVASKKCRLRFDKSIPNTTPILLT